MRAIWEWLVDNWITILYCIGLLAVMALCAGVWYLQKSCEADIWADAIEEKGYVIPPHPSS